MQAFGVDTGEYGPLWSDKIERGKPGGASGEHQLPGRVDLLREIRSGDRVIVADPYCAGVSGVDVSWFVGALAQAGVSLTVNGDLHHIEPGADASDLLKEVSKRQHTANMARYRASKRTVKNRS